MNSVYVYTALIDVLSYRHRLEIDIKSGENSFKDDLEKSLSILDQVNTSIFGIQAISDTIILTCNTHENFAEFLNILKSVFLSFLNRRLFIRGGLAYSKHFQSGRITYSHSIARAHELESTMSIYPRIVIDENIVQMYQSSNTLPKISSNQLMVQQNGVTFLNIIDQNNWKEIYALSADLYRNDKDAINQNETAFLKHLWFEKYLFESPFADITQQKYIDTPKLF